MRTWHPGIALWLSAALHLIAVIALFAWPEGWRSILAGIILNHVALALIGLWPRSRLLGENMVRLPDEAARRREIALTFDDGPDPDVTPKVLDILDAYHATASFFVIADKAAAYPALVRNIIKRGHSVENHSRRHPSFFACLGWAGLKKEIGSAQEIIARITGQAPSFFRAPMGFRNPLLDPLIARFGLRYVAWSRRGFDTAARNPDLVLERLTRNLGPGDILLLHDRRAKKQRAIVLEVLPALLEQIRIAGLLPVSLPSAMK